MSTEQIRAALKEAALKATPGPWIFQSYGKLMTVATVGHVEHYTFGPDCGEPHMIQYEDHADAEDDVRFCALANPATVLQLLAENEALRAQAALVLTAPNADTVNADRYLYLRNLCDENPGGPIVCVGLGDDFEFLRGADLDAAIDAAKAPKS